MMKSISDRVGVAGVGYSEIARDSGRTEHALAVDACLAAIADAGLNPGDIDGLGVYPDRVSGPFEGPPIDDLHHILGLGELSWWQAFGTGPAQFAPVIGGAYAISAGAARAVLVCRSHLRQRRRYYAHGLTSGGGAENGQAFRAPYGVPGGAPRMALWARRHMHEVGIEEEHLGAVTVLARAHAQLNPRAVWHGQPLTMEEYLASEYIAEPFRLLDCDYPVDGAVAVVLVDTGMTADLRHPPARIEAMGHRSGPKLDNELWPDMGRTASWYAAQDMWARTSLVPDDIDVAEVYDGFSWLALCWMEDTGLCAPGEAGPRLLDGWGCMDSELPMLTDGGHLGAGRLHGLGKLAESVLQLQGRAEQHQVPDAQVALACAGGGTVATSILLTAG